MIENELKLYHIRFHDSRVQPLGPQPSFIHAVCRAAADAHNLAILDSDIHAAPVA